jgi:gluconate 2-dehydrogenase subunit 3-like protein
VLKLFAGAAVLQLTAAQPGAPLYFSKEEFAALDELTEMIIPADDHSPGAHEAGVASFIDKTVAEAFLPEEKESWRKGLAPFLPLNTAQRLDLLSTLAAKEHNPQTDAARFFGQLKGSTAYAYYTSSVGIHQDIQYIGNVVQEQFSGYEVS